MGDPKNLMSSLGSHTTCDPPASRCPITDLRFWCAANVVTASEAREPDAYRDSSNRLLGDWRAYDAEATPPHSGPQLRTSKTVDSWVWLGATGGLGVIRWDTCRTIDCPNRQSDLASSALSCPQTTEGKSLVPVQGATAMSPVVRATAGRYRVQHSDVRQPQQNGPFFDRARHDHPATK